VEIGILPQMTWIHLVESGIQLKIDGGNQWGLCGSGEWLKGEGIRTSLQFT
jgi:hypothetical protein